MGMNPPASSKSSGGPPLLVVGAMSTVILIIWVYALLFQIATNEKQVLGYTVKIGFGVFNQWKALSDGSLDPFQEAAFIYGWGLEAFVILGVTMFDIALGAMRHSHPIIVRIFGFILIGCFILDWGSDYLFLPQSLGIPGRALVAILIAAAVTFLGVIAGAGYAYIYKHW